MGLQGGGGGGRASDGPSHSGSVGYGGNLYPGGESPVSEN